MNDNYDKILKCIFIGDPYVGKTSLCTKLVGNDFPLSYLSTIGVDFFVKIFNINNKNIKLQIWDTAGQEKYKAITRTFYRDISFVFLMFDLTDTKTFFNLKKWIFEINQYCNIKDLKIALIGNKSDLKSNINFNLIDIFCEDYNLKFYKCSVKIDNINDLIKKILNENLYNSSYNNMTIDDKNIKLNKKYNKDCCIII
jgi:small GTP-binding protein